VSVLRQVAVAVSVGAWVPDLPWCVRGLAVRSLFNRKGHPMAVTVRVCNAMSILPLLDLVAWWRWLPNGPGEFVSALACEALSGGADSQACYLIVDHPGEHSWEIL